MSIMEGGALPPAPRAFHLPTTAAVPHRKPVPQQQQQHLQQQQQQLQQPQQSAQNTEPAQNTQDLDSLRPQPLAPTTHNRSRTASSSLLPTSDQVLAPPPLNPRSSPPSSYKYQLPPQAPSTNQENSVPPPINNRSSRRSFSSNTNSTMSMTTSMSMPPNTGLPVRQNSSSSSLQRSTSSRSGGQSTSYVSLMRKQKATVWSDRAQHEDPRLVAQRHAAKIRAAAEVSNAHRAGSMMSAAGGVRSKIRHHGAPKAREYIQTGPQHGVPLRLSQNEMDEGDDDGGEDASPYNRLPSGLGMGGGLSPQQQQQMQLHKRTDSSRSSVGSGSAVRPTHSPYSSHPQGISPNSRTSPNQEGSEPGTTQTFSSAEETPVPGNFRGQEYFSGINNKSNVQDGPYKGGGDMPSMRSTGSGSGSSNTSAGREKEESFGQARKLPMKVVRNTNANGNGNMVPEEADGEGLSNEEMQKKIEADLRRRGSVDERTMTMSTGLGRLFIANPDA